MLAMTENPDIPKGGRADVARPLSRARPLGAAILMRGARLALCATLSAILHASPARTDEAPLPRAEGWLVRSYERITVPAAARTAREDLAALEAAKAGRTAEDIARFRWWAVGGPVHRWNEIVLEELQENFVVLPLAARHLALFHAALDDAVMVARHHRTPAARPGPAASDPAIDVAVDAAARRTLSPSEHAAAAAAAAEVLGYLVPARAAHLSARAEEAMQVRVRAGVDFPHEVALGRSIGQQIAALAIARGKSDRADAKWSGSVPEGAGLWKGTNPIMPLAGTWQPWVLSHPGELRPSAPPAFDSAEAKAALVELKTFARSPRTNHRATFWEVNGGARAHTLWNEMARAKLLEAGVSAPVAARTLAALNIAMADAGVACWEAKYAYWYVRPPQLDAELRPLFSPPNHPSYPAAHGCFSTAAATVLARVLPRDGERLLALGKEAAEARIWAGIHFRFDLDAGQELGRKVAERTLARAFATPTQ